MIMVVAVGDKCLIPLHADVLVVRAINGDNIDLVRQEDIGKDDKSDVVTEFMVTRNYFDTFGKVLVQNGTPSQPAEIVVDQSEKALAACAGMWLELQQVLRAIEEEHLVSAYKILSGLLNKEYKGQTEESLIEEMRTELAAGNAIFG
jgi:hypothetical protein